MSVQRVSLRRHEGIFLISIACLALLASAVAGYVGYHHANVAAAEEDDDALRIPLPAGPRKYQ